MTTVLTNNSPTLFRSIAIPLTATSTKQSTPAVHRQNAPALTLEEKADKILLKAKSPMRVDEARAVADALEKLLDFHCRISLSTRRRCFRGLTKLCGEYGVLPASYFLTESKMAKLKGAPVSTGGFSNVWRGMYDGRPVAVKIMTYSAQDGIQTIEKSFCREVIAWKRLRHPNILELVGVLMSNKSYATVTPWMGNGNIVDYVRDEPQTNSLKLLEDVTLGLQYLHSMDLAHGDLKPANILIGDDGRAYLADFGLTRLAGDLGSSTTTSTTEGGFSVRWCPPELLDPERFRSTSSGPTKNSDIYSMAMTIYQVLTDRVPYYDCGELQAMLRIMDGVRPQKPIFVITRGYTEDLWKVTTSCWDEVPTERPTVEQVLEVLRISAEQWKSPLSFSPRDDASLTLCAEESDSLTLSEPDDEHDTTDPSPPLDQPHSPVTKTASKKDEIEETTPFKSGAAIAQASSPLPAGFGMPPQLLPDATNHTPKPPQILSSRQRALQRLVSGAAPPGELGSLIEAVISDAKADNIANHLQGSDAQTFADMLDQALDEIDFSPETRNECARLLCAVCAGHALIPRSMCLELSEDTLGDVRCRGGSGIVSKCEYRGQEVAVKVLQSGRHSSQEMLKRFWKEVITWRAVQHPNILPLFGVAVAEDQFAMVSEWMANGNIKEYIGAHQDANRYELLADATKGLIHIHSQGMIHRDLKAANILVNQDGHACLADFGLLTIASGTVNTTSPNSSLPGGTIRWMGPELFEPAKFGLTGRRRTKLSDCYALGMVVYEVLSGRVPFYQYDDVAVIPKILKGDRPERPQGVGRLWVTDDIWSTLEGCWKAMPDDRPSAEDVLRRLEEVPMPSPAQIVAGSSVLDPPASDLDLRARERKEEHIARLLFTV